MSATIALPAGILEPAVRTAERWERTLARREVFVLNASGDLSLSCIDGVLWITLDGDTADYVVLPGQRLRLARGAVATVQAIRAARFGVGRA